MADTRTVRLAWLPSPSPDVVGYEVARAGAPNPVAVVHTTVTLGWDDERPFGSWTYRVRAVDAAGNRSVWSEGLTALVTPAWPAASVVRLTFARALTLAPSAARASTAAPAAARPVTLSPSAVHAVTVRPSARALTLTPSASAVTP